MKKVKSLYIAYDEDGLPIYVEDNLKALADKLDITTNRLSVAISEGAKVKWKYPVAKVKFEGEE